MNARLGLAALALLLAAGSSVAEIYRYQDANGRWQYTDKAPPDQAKPEVVTLKGAAPATPDAADEKALADSGNDLDAYLTNKINPANDIEKATLAVVKVQTPYGSGSGFFVNERGFLVTNKHVVRPGDFEQFSGELKKAEDSVQQGKNALAKEAEDLDHWQKRLDDYQRRMEEYPPDIRARMEEQYRDSLTNYKAAEAEYRRQAHELDKAKQNLTDRQGAMSESSAASTFKIIFKDGTEKQALLVATGKDHDLALLRLVGKFRTPFLEQGERNAVPQGSEVYAIGSPLGFRDFVTKGIVTRQEQDKIVTDTEILPGNSGGPLVTSSGKVIGVNTQAYRANGTVGSEVFGFAIPIDAVRAEFSSRW